MQVKINTKKIVFFFLELTAILWNILCITKLISKVHLIFMAAVLFLISLSIENLPDVLAINTESTKCINEMKKKKKMLQVYTDTAAAVWLFTAAAALAL